MKLETMNSKLSEKKAVLSSKIEEVRASAQDEESSIDDVKAGMAEIEGLKADIEALSDQIKTLNEALDLEPEAPAEDAKPEPKPEDAKSEGKRDEGDIEIPEDDTDEETRSGKDITNMEAVIGKQNSAFEDFLKSGEVRDGLTTVEGAVVIPKEILDIQKVPNDPTQLASYVNRVAVTSGVGSLPVLAKNTARLASTAELAQNPELAKLSLTGVDYKALTYRGVLPVSMEMLQDAPEIELVVSEYVAEAKALTEQYKIGEVLQKAAAVTVSNVDGIKDAFNKGLSNYNRMFVVSESFFAEIDKIKDADGRYLLQDSITSPSGKQLLGASVVVVADDVLGKAGEAHAFVGDVKAFALEAMRSDIAVEWQDDDIFGKKLAVALRADWQVADAQAGKFLTFAPAPAK
ncbi:phage major capsid protein [Weissella confusa]|uniref:phage major capsid protein n=1 Tax=Weissella confusa TaxID=1583 RepID=UPI0013DF54A2|nr:phage major capsid protein [Weissella confusa]QIE79801.1 phage major capsid protein [Weissella confusa]